MSLQIFFVFFCAAVSTVCWKIAGLTAKLLFDRSGFSGHLFARMRALQNCARRRQASGRTASFKYKRQTTSSLATSFLATTFPAIRLPNDNAARAPPLLLSSSVAGARRRGGRRSVPRQ
jgi:hypothetical protein